MSCSSEQHNPGASRRIRTCGSGTRGWARPAPYIWAPITWLLYRAGIDWRYYVGEGTCVAPPCLELEGTTIAAVQNPPRLPGHGGDGQLDHVRSNEEFAGRAIRRSPPVSWVMPVVDRGEHPPDSIELGQAYVARLDQLGDARATRPVAPYRDIFLTWDDWGGFYDHVEPPVVDENGWGLRVPSLPITRGRRQTTSLTRRSATTRS